MATALLLCVMALMTGAYGQACGVTFTASFGSFSSPWYPSSYPNNQNCTYSIAGPIGSQVILVFSVFNLANWNSDCSKDRVEILDSCAIGDPLIGKFCGSSIPPLLTSASHCLQFTFLSDGSDTGPGFVAAYTIIP